ncbi:hypothetical protein BT93_H2660 [Corymbia citriodora subsp. variegata]|nr:hypothetical protein BT93_H2660 [Corymbia citriodora subsp. variegata]
MGILSARIYHEMVEDAAYFHQQQQQNPSFSLDDEFDLLHPHFPSEPCSTSSPSHLLPLISPETVPGFTPRFVKNPQEFTNRPQKQLKTESWNSLCTTKHETMTCNLVMSPSPSLSQPPESHFISFGNPDSSSAISNPSYGTYKIQDCEGPRMKSTHAMSRKPVHTQENVLAERKRREKISKLFIALSAVIPNLKKKDKASILEDAIRYLKELQQRLKALEEEVAAAKTVESVAVVKKSELTSYNDTSLSGENSCGHIDQQLSLLDIEARISGKCILIKIHCENRRGFISKMIGQIEKQNLIVVSSCILPFGSSILDITILAQMDVGFSLKMRDLMRNLRQALLDLM